MSRRDGEARPSRLKPLLQRHGGAALAWLLLTAARSWAAFITPEQAGFHHCMLIYDAEAREAEGFLPYVAHLDAAGKPDGWLFDAFLLCAHQPGPATKASYHFGATNREDWEALQDGWFAEGRGLTALQGAVDEAREALGARPKPLEVVLTIPYPSAEQTDFGDVDGDGVSEDLSRVEAREAAVKWYIDRALAQWQELKAPDLHLWGFYWTNEGISANDVGIVQRAARIVHERGYRFLWIPWFRAPGFRLWRDFGFDVAILQPNYAFLSQHLGKVRSDRLIETASLADSLGMGVEMEVGYSPERDLREREIFREYLAFGAPNLCGYQEAATAYFQSLQVFPNLLHAEDPDARRVYDEIAAYVRGEPVARPNGLKGSAVTLGQTALPELVDGVLEAGRHTGGTGLSSGERVGPITIEFPEPRPVGEVELSCVRDKPWSGIVTADVQDAAGNWRPGGWVTASVSRRNEDGGIKSIIAVPVFVGEARGVRIDGAADELMSLRVEDPEVAGPLTIDEVTVTCGPPRLDWKEPNLAYGKPYFVEPDFPRRYPDRGGMLTDGEVSTEGWTQGRSVGWWGDELTVMLDLGRRVEPERVVVHCDGGGYGAVSFPDRVQVKLSEIGTPAPADGWGLGAPPPAASTVADEDLGWLQIDGQRTVDDGTTAAWGHYELDVRGRPARFITLNLWHRDWLMLSEIEVWSRGANVALGAKYLFTPAPTGAEDANYADDGRLLTDGCVATTFMPKRVAGWSGASEIALTVDLGVEQDVHEVVVQTLGGGRYGILAPPSGRLELSSDGETYRQVAEAALEEPARDTSVALGMQFGLGKAERARFVRVRLAPSPQWTMVSEVSVR